MPAPTYVDGEENPAGNGSSGTSVVVTWADVTFAADDLVLYPIYRETTAAYTATPAGWAQVSGFPVDQDTGGFKYRADLWWKRATGSESGTDTWSWSGAAWRFSEYHLWRNAITSENPVIQAVADKETSQNAEPAHPGITIQRSNSGLIWFVYNFSDAGNTTTPTGFTYRQPPGSNNRNILTYDDLTTATGASGTVTGDLSDPEWSLSVLVELATEAGGGAPVGYTPGTSLDFRRFAGRRRRSGLYVVPQKPRRLILPPHLERKAA